MERIDTHSHVLTPSFVKYSKLYGFDRPDGMPGLPDWSVESHIAFMDKLGIAKSILSITSPGTHLTPGDDITARKITREINGEIAQIRDQYPSRFGFFASLPLPNIEGSLAEIDYALDNLGANGFALMTNTHGFYLGDKELEPVFEKLNERNAIVFMHPTTGCNKDHRAPKPLNQFPSPMMEFFFDTSRVVVNLILSGTVERYPNITYLVSHCGAVLPPLLERFTALSGFVKAQHQLTSDEAKELFKTRFYFDLAGFPFPDQIHGLMRILDSSRLLYGSDYPYTAEAMILRQGKDLDAGLSDLFGDEEIIKAINAGNAKKALGL